MFVLWPLGGLVIRHIDLGWGEPGLYPSTSPHGAFSNVIGREQLFFL
jgi:hypothetical protein